MKVTGRETVFNLMDTNGRRNDVVNAIQGYLTILDEVLGRRREKWAAMPESTVQAMFYKMALDMFPDVFKKHDPYDKLLDEMQQHREFTERFEQGDVAWIQRNADQYPDLLADFDTGIEDRARHYTSNLVKLGLADENRNITPAGYMLLHRDKPDRDSLERLLPIDDVNLVYLRQLLKLRVYDKNGARYYAPLPMAIYLLLKRGRVSERDFKEIVQGLGPYADLTDIDRLIDNYHSGDVYARTTGMPEVIRQEGRLTRAEFGEHFDNRKTGASVDTYWRFYTLVFDLRDNPSGQAMNRLFDLCDDSDEGPVLSKAFGGGRKVFGYRRGARPDLATFLDEHDDLFGDDVNLNEALYTLFKHSKTRDMIREYGDTTKRIFKATGIIRFDNGFVELANRELCQAILDPDHVRAMIAGVGRERNAFDRYEAIDGDFGAMLPLTRILGYTSQDTAQAEGRVRAEFPDRTLDEISTQIRDRRRAEFDEFIQRRYPVSEVERILGMFINRNDDAKVDRQIQEAVNPDADVPTIYEYIVGIAWYHFSGRKIDLLKSFNLNLDADFAPILHAGGGKGDIVIEEQGRVIMLEVTLMNPNAQKRGEWEPVLRHSINLKVDEELRHTGRQVTTFFIADQLDNNTVNIWRAVASVPLESSTEAGEYTDNVTIMPLTSDELARLMHESPRYEQFIASVRDFFKADADNSFDKQWREKLVARLI